MILHENPKLFAQAVRATADKMGILPIYVEKDYWVTLALWHIFRADSGVADHVVFKGGTSLSKCFHIIERFSEDIDLVLLQTEALSDNQRKKRLKMIGQAIEAVLPEIDIAGLTNKRGMIRKTAHAYPQHFTGEFGQIRQHIVLECSWLGNYEPYEQAQVISFIGQMMLDSNLNDMANQQGLLPFAVKTLSPERTFCEKIMSLVRFSYADDPIAELRLKIRHCYDLHQLLQQPNIQAFMNSEAFAMMLKKVREDDMGSQAKNRSWLEKPIHQSLMFANLEATWQQLVPTYEHEFRALVYGKLPTSAEVLGSLQKIKARLASIVA